MRRVDLDHLEPGMKLALPVRCQHSYQILLNAGVVVNQNQIDKIRKLSPGPVYVFCPDFGNHPGRTLYRQAVATMDNVFQNVFAGQKVNTAEVEQVVNSILGQLEESKQILVQLARLNDADSYSITHCVNVCVYSLFIGELMGVLRHELGTLGLGALLHDIGKLRVPQDLLQKAGKLTDEEFSTIKGHSLIGYESLDSNEVAEEVRVIVRDHHEKLDGTGYPNGISGEDISFFTRIVTVADIYDAVSSDRAYRPKMLPHEGMEILIANSSAGKLDREVVEAFTRGVIAYPPGCTVRLNTGQTATVIEGSTVNWRPRVRIEGKKPVILDLAENPTVFIVEIVRYAKL